MEDLQSMINRLCPDGVEYKPLSEVGTFTRGRRFVRADIVNEGYPCIHYGDLYTYYGLSATETRTFISPELASKLRFAEKNDVIIVGAGENDEDIGIGLAWLGDSSPAVHDACYIFKHHENPKYISYFLRSHDYHQQIKKSVSSGKICSISADGIGKAIMPVPPVDIQNRIVDILDSFIDYTEKLKAELSAELEARQKQYEFYRDKLLSFNNINGGGYDIAINWIPLKMCCAINKGDYLTKKDAHVGTVPVILGGQQPAYYIDRANHSGDAIVVSRSGASAGFVSWWHEPIFVTDGFLIEPCESLRHRFVYHYLKSIQAQLNASKRGSGVPHITSEMLSNVPIPVIPLSLQDRITTLLDTLNELSTKLVQELHTEIQARQQQYEYYRDKLLTFKRKAVA